MPFNTHFFSNFTRQIQKSVFSTKIISKHNSNYRHSNILFIFSSSGTPVTMIFYFFSFYIILQLFPLFHLFSSTINTTFQEFLYHFIPLHFCFCILSTFLQFFYDLLGTSVCFLYAFNSKTNNFFFSSLSTSKLHDWDTCISKKISSNTILCATGRG